MSDKKMEAAKNQLRLAGQINNKAAQNYYDEIMRPDANPDEAARLFTLASSTHKSWTDAARKINELNEIQAKQTPDEFLRLQDENELLRKEIDSLKTKTTKRAHNSSEQIQLEQNLCASLGPEKFPGIERWNKHFATLLENAIENEQSTRMEWQEFVKTLSCYVETFEMETEKMRHVEDRLYRKWKEATNELKKHKGSK